MAIAEPLSALARDLADIFGARLEALVTYGSANATTADPIRTLALVTSLTLDDLVACAGHVSQWHRQRLATPLVLPSREFGRALDAFPFEFGAIIDDHTVVAGSDPFATLRVDAGDLRRACEVQARSHLLHLREAFIETANRAADIAALIERSAGPLAALPKNLALLGGEPPAGVLSRVAQITPKSLAADEAQRLLPEYVRALEQLVASIDRWGAP
jgi:hypothetical protein